MREPARGRHIVAVQREDGVSVLGYDGPLGTVFHSRAAGGALGGAPRPIEPGAELDAGEGLVGEAARLDAGGELRAPVLDPAFRLACAPGQVWHRLSVFTPGRSAPLHRTPTLDLDTVLDGSVTLILGDGAEVGLRAGDFVTLPGVEHGWRAGPEGCRISVVMVGLTADALAHQALRLYKELNLV